MEQIEQFIPQSSPFIVGVVSDTHIPDRVGELHPALLAELEDQHVQLILHAGDIAVKSVLSTLATIAPVRAVTGNRDFLLSQDLPMHYEMEIYGARVILSHGHLGTRLYWQDKFSYITRGYVLERYRNRFDHLFKHAKVIVFGHTHHIENQWIDGRLYFNPGSVSHGDSFFPSPYYGVLKFYEDGRIESSLKPLTGAMIRNKKWEKTR
jgi:putative phosphoesterase